MDAARMLPQPQGKRQLPSKNKIPSIFSRYPAGEFEGRNTSQPRLRLTGGQSARDAPRTPFVMCEELKSCRLVRFPQVLNCSKDFDMENPELRSVKRLIQPKILKCPYGTEERQAQRRACSAGVKRSPLEYTFGRS